MFCFFSFAEVRFSSSLGMGRGKEQRIEAKRRLKEEAKKAAELSASPQEVPKVIQKKHEKKDILVALERSLQLRILTHLRPYELCLIQRVSRSWSNLTLLNDLWWPLAMKVWIEVFFEVKSQLLFQVLWIESERPRTTHPKLLKKDPGKWKGHYRDAVISQREKVVQVRAKEAKPEWDQAPTVRTSLEVEMFHLLFLWQSKDDMRAYYKSIRSNPKGKKPARDRTLKFESCQYDEEMWWWAAVDGKVYLNIKLFKSVICHRISMRFNSSSFFIGPFL